MTDNEPSTAFLVTVTLTTGYLFFDLFDAAIQRKKAVDRERNKLTLSSLASASKPGAVGYWFFGFFTLFSLITVIPILLAVSVPIPDNLGLFGVVLGMVYAVGTVQGTLSELY